MPLTPPPSDERPPVSPPRNGSRGGELTREVLQSFDQASARLRVLMQRLVSHLHTFVLDNYLTDTEWRLRH